MTHLAQAIDQFSDWRWRLNNLYWIVDKDGNEVQFKMNWAQEHLFDSMSYLNVILKARQFGFTTFIQIFMLDACVFNSNIRAGTIAHTIGDAQVIFRDKVKLPYDRLPEGIKGAVPIVSDNLTEMMLGNNSSIRVGVSMRSGTLQYLHISEYGKICAKFPEKAREVRTGALNTVQAGQIVFIESTAEGQEGHFYDLCQSAQTKARTGERLTELDFKFHFFPWWKMPDYQIEAAGVVVDDAFARYFRGLEEQHGISLTPEQKAWYVKKAETQLDDMKREFPSTPEEAFEAAVEGAYYGGLMAKAEHEGRIGDFPHVPGVPVNATFDIGYGDYTAIWFDQIVEGRPRLVGYYQNSGEGMPHYIAEMKRRGVDLGWKFGEIWLPHDGKVHEWGTGLSREEQVREAFKGSGATVRVSANLSLEDGINAVRAILPHCTFDKAGTAEGIACLKNYRKEWDEERGVWKDRPRHDSASHGADAFRGLALRWKARVPAPKPQPPPKKHVLEVNAQGVLTSNMSVKQIIEWKRRRKAADE